MMGFVCFVLVGCVLLFIFLLCCCCFVCLFHVVVVLLLFVFCLFCFVEVLDDKLNPMLAYASEIWETVRLHNK